MVEGNNLGYEIQNSEPRNIQGGFNPMNEIETSQQYDDSDMPNRSEPNIYCEMPSDPADYDDDMPHFDAMLADFEGPHVPWEYKAIPTLKVDAKTDLYLGCKKKYS